MILPESPALETLEELIHGVPSLELQLKVVGRLLAESEQAARPPAPSGGALGSFGATYQRVSVMLQQLDRSQELLRWIEAERQAQQAIQEVRRSTSYYTSDGRFLHAPAARFPDKLPK